VPRHSPRYGFDSEADKQAARKEFQARERARAASRRQNATALERSVAERRRVRANLPLRKLDVAEAAKLDLHRYRMAVKVGMDPARGQAEASAGGKWGIGRRGRWSVTEGFELSALGERLGRKRRERGGDVNMCFWTSARRDNGLVINYSNV
jgi:hypothetical protein